MSQHLVHCRTKVALLNLFGRKHYFSACQPFNRYMSNPVRFLSALVLTGCLCGSCSHQNAVVSGNLLQKRKYRSGFHLETPAVFRQKQADAAPQVCGDSGKHTAERVQVTGANRQPVAPLLNQAASSRGVARGDAHGIFTPRFTRESDTIIAPGFSEVTANEYNTEPVISDVPGFGQGVNYYQDEDPYERAGTLSVTFGLLNFLLLWLVPFVGVALAGLAIYFGIKALNSAEPSTKVLGIVGMILGFISLLMALIWTMFVIALLFLGL